MSRRLILPDGVRLADEDEIPGPPSTRAELWGRVQAANLSPGFVLHDSNDPRFALYVEANIDAPQIWNVFEALCLALFDAGASLLVNDVDDETSPTRGEAHAMSLVQLLAPHRYQLAHDGRVQFGLVHQGPQAIVEVLVAPTKHFMVWTSDAAALRDVFAAHDVPEVNALEFLDQFPRATFPLDPERTGATVIPDLVERLRGAAATLTPHSQRL